MAKKGDLRAVTHLNVGLDEALSKALETSARQNERRLNQEVRYGLRVYLGLMPTPAEDTSDVVPA